MNILYLFAAIIAVLAGFIGLIVIIKGFVDKSNKQIKLGTLLFCVMLIIGVLGAFCAGKHCMDKRRCHEEMMEKCMHECGPMMMGGCASMDSIKDSNGVKVITKVIMDKECMKKCDMKCDKKCDKPCPGEKK